VLIFVNTGRDVGDHDHLKVFASEETAEEWFGKMIRKASRLNIR
jgi:hypothetical protein